MTAPATRSRRELAEAAWGTPLPDWIEALADAMDASSQNQVARDLGLSAAALYAALKNTYRSPLTNIESVVRAALNVGGVDCPELGALTAAQCRAWTKKADVYTGASRLSARMTRACRTCPQNPMKGPRHD